MSCHRRSSVIGGPSLKSRNNTEVPEDGGRVKKAVDDHLGM
jgi:hypothetical protein